MKTSHKHIIAALAVTLALASCTKDVIAEKEDVNPQDGGLRTIAVSFGASTKTYLEGDLIPRFNGGEEILISNGDNYERLTVDASSGKATITTALSGRLMAVYPSKAAKLEGTSITGIQVPSNQTGRFADANIAIAKIDENQNYAMFQNQTAVLKFYVDRSIGVTALAIKARPDGAPISDGYIDEQGVKDEEKSQEKDFNTFSVTVMPETDDENWTLADQTDDPEQRVCYVAIRSDGATLNMGVTSRTKTQLYEDENIEQTGRLQYQQKGIVSRLFENVSLKPGDLANVFIPYYIPVNVGTEAEHEYQYWAYCNVGAFLPEEPGYYFSWGNTDGHWLNAESEEYQFTNEVYSDTPGGKITESRLTPESDAAYVAWGGKWRMPTKTESMILKERVSRDYRSRYERYGYCFGDLFLPAAGHIADFGGSMVQWNKETSSEFWTSDKYSDNQYAYYFYKSPDTDSDMNLRHEGIPIRPIYGDPAQEQVALEINKYKEGPTL